MIVYEVAKQDSKDCKTGLTEDKKKQLYKKLKIGIKKYLDKYDLHDFKQVRIKLIDVINYSHIHYKEDILKATIYNNKHIFKTMWVNGNYLVVGLSNDNK
jgi:hypothetical protein